MNVLIVTAFFYALYRQQLHSESVIKWAVLALIPQVFLGGYQFLSQHVVGSTWLGMSSQYPEIRGVSVIETAGNRILRAYGGFPHPNIFGGWLAVSIPWIWLFIMRAKHRVAMVWMALSFVFIACLALTFSRSAWIATACMGVLAFRYFLHSTTNRRRLWVMSILAIISFSLVLVGYHSLFVTRLSLQGRLETRSVNERFESLRHGKEIFLKHPFVGIGPGTTILGLSQAQVLPPIPTHFIPLMMMMELGVLGIFGFLMIGWICLRRLPPRISLLRSWAVVPLTAIGVLSLFDHYLWSLWPGQALSALLVFLIMSEHSIANSARS